MSRKTRVAVVAVAWWVLLGAPHHAAGAESRIIQLSAAGQPAIDIRFDGAVLSTAGTQPTAVSFSGFLDWLPEISQPAASFRLEGLKPAGEASVFAGSLLMQKFTGGSVSLYDADDTLLLSGDLSLPWLAGNIGLADGGLFTTHFSQVTGGALASYIVPDSLVLQMHFWNVNGGDGFSIAPASASVSPHVATLNSFTASVTADFEGAFIPEPTSLMLLVLAALSAAALGRRRSRL